MGYKVTVNRVGTINTFLMIWLETFGLKRNQKGTENSLRCIMFSDLPKNTTRFLVNLLRANDELLYYLLELNCRYILNDIKFK